MKISSLPGQSRDVLLFLLFAFLASTQAYSDAAVPLIASTAPAMVVMSIPIILIEMFVLSRKLEIDKIAAFWVSGWMNLASAIVGVPLAPALALGLDIFAIRTRIEAASASHPNILTRIHSVMLAEPWEIRPGYDLFLLFPLVTVIFLVPFFVLSWQIELRVAKNISPTSEIEPRFLRRTVLIANGWSYTGLALFILGYFILLYASSSHPQ